MLAMLLPVHGGAAGRHISLVIDTSSSMLDNDPPRYTLQLSQILADLLEQGDSLTVIRMPRQAEHCGDPADFGLARQMEAFSRSGFQQELGQLLSYDSGTHFAAPIHTAIADLARHAGQARLLLFIADAGGLGDCEQPLNQELSRLKAEGVMIAAINLGGEGAFENNPAFHFSAGAMDAGELVDAVALVYQRFIGGKAVKTGRIQDLIEVEVQPWSRQAYLVVAADGEIGGVDAAAGNPPAAEIDYNHKGGGEAIGLDSKRRQYRIVRLGRPEAGAWRFRVYGSSAPAGWMFLQDSALALRLVSSPSLAQGLSAPMEVELFDQETGQRVVADPALWPGLKASMVVDGKTVQFLDDGQHGDRQAGDGIFTAQVTPARPGTQHVPLRLGSPSLDRTVDVALEVGQFGWRLKADVPPRVGFGNPLKLTVEAQALPGADSKPLDSIEVGGAAGEKLASLHDDGQGSDAQAGDGRYSGVWTPEQVGGQILGFTGVGGGMALPLRLSVEVVGSIQFPEPKPVAFGQLAGGSQAEARLDLTGAVVKGGITLDVGSDFEATGSVLEADFGEGWVSLAATPRRLTLTPDGPRQWPLRVRVGECPGGVGPGHGFAILLQGRDVDGKPVIQRIPVSLEIVEDPWLHCWWPLLAAGGAVLLAGILFHGFWSPSRFSPRLGVVLSPEEDMGEGFFHPIRAQRGTGSGFYRDARAYIRQDYRLSGSAKAALACLRACGKRVKLKPAAGQSLLWLNLDGEWESVPAEESPVHFGVVYKDAMGSLYFEIRNG